MTFSVLTYNTLFNQAVNKLGVIVNKLHPDIICLQEFEIDRKNLLKIEKLGYRLADYSNSFIKFGKIYGVATFYNPDKLIFKQSSELKLGSNLLEIFFTLIQILIGYNKTKTILKTDFIDKKAKKDFSVCNLHLYVVGSNELRINHLNQALKSINLKKNKSLVVCGDFNYFPYRRKKLERAMKKHGLVEATKNIRQTVNVSGTGILEKFTRFQRFLVPFYNKFLVKRLKLDYIFYRGLKLVKTERLEDRHSDHYPIYSTFDL